MEENKSQDGVSNKKKLLAVSAVALIAVFALVLSVANRADYNASKAGFLDYSSVQRTGSTGGWQNYRDTSTGDSVPSDYFGSNKSIDIGGYFFIPLIPSSSGIVSQSAYATAQAVGAPAGSPTMASGSISFSNQQGRLSIGGVKLDRNGEYPNQISISANLNMQDYFTATRYDCVIQKIVDLPQNFAGNSINENLSGPGLHCEIY